MEWKGNDIPANTIFITRHFKQALLSNVSFKNKIRINWSTIEIYVNYGNYTELI